MRSGSPFEPTLLALVLAGCLLAALPAAGGDVVQVGSVSLAQPGQSLVIPVTVRDLSGTILDGDAGPGRTIQSLALSVRILPAGSFGSASLDRAGAAGLPTPLFETPASTSNQRSLIMTFDAVNDPLVLTLDGPLPGDIVAELSLQVSPGFDAGTIQLVLAPATNALGNQRGTLTESRANEQLELVGGSVLVDSSGIFVDGFESGDTSAW